MELKYKDMLKALGEVETEKNIDEEVILEALKDGIVKAYKKDSGLEDIEVYAEINNKKKTIDIYQSYVIVASDDDITDDELEISLEEARKLDRTAVEGGRVSRLVEIDSMSRGAVNVCKSVMRQKIREAEKKVVYSEYIDKLDEMVVGEIESVKDKFALIKLDKTIAMLPRSQQIPGEVLKEGNPIRVVITEVNNDTKGSQVLVSRSSPVLVKRLFEKEVPEIFQGVVEIKAIARDAGERTKMAVITHNPDVDPIGACIGPRGQRVQMVIDEIKGEKIDVFQYSNDITELVRNALAPAEVIAVLPVDEETQSASDDSSKTRGKSLLVIVDDSKLSLAIGKKGKNARLAVKLTNHKIDIKTRKALEEEGVDYDALLERAEQIHAEMMLEQKKAESERYAAAMKAADEKIQARAAKLAEKNGETIIEEDNFIPEEMMETISDNIRTEMTMIPDAEEENEASDSEAAAKIEETVSVEAETAETTEQDEMIEETEMVEETEADEEIEETVKTVEKKVSSKHADLEELAANNTYVSRFEKLADTSKGKQDVKGKKKFGKKKTDEDGYKLSNKELQKQLNSKLVNQAAKPIYSDEELAEIQAQQEAEEERQYDIDYDEYEDYYDEDDD